MSTPAQKESPPAEDTSTREVALIEEAIENEYRKAFPVDHIFYYMGKPIGLFDRPTLVKLVMLAYRQTDELQYREKERLLRLF